MEKDAEDCSAVELSGWLQESLETIRHVSRVSKGLKGTLAHDLKLAVANISEVGEVLLNRNATEEVDHLRRQNRRLTEQVGDLRKDLDNLKNELRAERRKKMPVECPTTTDNQPAEDSIKKLLNEMEERFTSRLAALEGIRLRPPLGATSRRKRQTADTGDPTPTDAPPIATASKGRKTKTKKPAAMQSTTEPETAPAVAQKSQQGGWVTVGAKKKAKKAAKKSAKQKVSPKAPKPLRVPRTSAVVITLQPAALERGASYAEVIRKAKQDIDLGALGMTGVRLKQARTGARLLELPGAYSEDKADILAAKLRETFQEEDIRISRPQKRIDLRLSGLDDSVEQAEIAEAIIRASQGGCNLTDLKVGPIRRYGGGSTGPGTAVVNCPVAVAQKIADGRRVYVGWTSAQVKLLPPRPARCFKCFRVGHLGVHCTESVDCSGKCFHCGQPGHKASTCVAPPHCIVCTAAGKPADHRVGSKTCAPPKSPQRKGPTANTKVAPAPAAQTAATREGEEMES